MGGKRAGPALPSVAWACWPTSTSGALAERTFPPTPARSNLKTRPTERKEGEVAKGRGTRVRRFGPRLMDG